jgi:hypothetical protein
MIRAFVLYGEEPDPQRYARHVELCERVAGGIFRHGRIFGAPMGAPLYSYYAEWEFPDMETFKKASRSPEFIATGTDAVEMGIEVTVLFAELN